MADHGERRAVRLQRLRSGKVLHADWDTTSESFRLLHDRYGKHQRIKRAWLAQMVTTSLLIAAGARAARAFQWGRTAAAAAAPGAL